MCANEHPPQLSEQRIRGGALAFQAGIEWVRYPLLAQLFVCKR